MNTHIQELSQRLLFAHALFHLLRVVLPPLPYLILTIITNSYHIYFFYIITLHFLHNYLILTTVANSYHKTILRSDFEI